MWTLLDEFQSLDLPCFLLSKSWRQGPSLSGYQLVDPALTALAGMASHGKVGAKGLRSLAVNHQPPYVA
jgi:hypothetical protein